MFQDKRTYGACADGFFITIVSVVVFSFTVSQNTNNSRESVIVTAVGISIYIHRMKLDANIEDKRKLTCLKRYPDLQTHLDFQILDQVGCDL